ncbi:hypothetical protein BC835DRAFT_1416789 [Cytidiella melzeri]|nr:hypothetical protein BC835DRAFT_1416789 [Cytidiella melzeri]
MRAKLEKDWKKPQYHSCTTFAHPPISMYAKTSAYSLDPAVWSLGDKDQLTCLLCPSLTSGLPLTIARRYAQGHESTARHKQRLQYRWQLQEANIELSKLQEAEVQRQEMQGIEESPDTSQDEAPLVDISHDPVPFSELWQLQDCEHSVGVLEVDKEEEEYAAKNAERNEMLDPEYELFEDDMQDEHPEQDTIGIAICSGFIVLSMAVQVNLLLTSPRLRFPDAQISAMLKWAKALHARDIPTLYAIKKMRQDLRCLVGDPTKKVVSPSGNIFYINDIGAAVAKDYANPLT